MTTDAEIQKVFEEFWQDIVMPNGEWDLEQVKKELYDYRQIMVSVSRVYDHITLGRITKPNTAARVVIEEADEIMNGFVYGAVSEAIM